MKFFRFRSSVNDFVVDIDGLVDWLMEEFNIEKELRDLLVRSIQDSGNSGFEFILDSPVSANWRLKRNKEYGPFGVRVSDYRLRLHNDSKEVEYNKIVESFYHKVA